MIKEREFNKLCKSSEDWGLEIGDCRLIISNLSISNFLNAQVIYAPFLKLNGSP